MQMNDDFSDVPQVPFGTDDFADNPEPRCPLLLLLDNSYSMSGKPISELNAGLSTLKEELISDTLASKRVEVGIISFGPIKIVNDFQSVLNFIPPNLVPSGNTPMGSAISQGLELLEDRKETYKSNGIAYYRPWVMLITDGAPTDTWQDAALKVREGENAKTFAFFAIGVEGASMDILKQISVRHPLKLKGLKFRELFLWLSSSMRSVSHSVIGEAVPLENPASPQGWAEV
jgi:uncharacterized protein YegL